MPRIARIVLVDVPHHVTQRGNNRQDVFFTEDDRRQYLRILESNCRRFGVRVLAFCLMTNHVHLVAVPAKPDSLAKAVGRTNWLYTQYVNRLHGRSGHLWQNRFHSAAMDDAHAVEAMRYVEQNPLRARLCRLAQRWPWSSAAAHVSGIDTSGLLDMREFARLSRGLNWREKLAERIDPELLRRLRGSWRTGRPLASDRWLARLEAKMGRRLRPLPVGRPRGAKTRKRRATRDRATSRK